MSNENIPTTSETMGNAEPGPALPEQQAEPTPESPPDMEQEIVVLAEEVEDKRQRHDIGVRWLVEAGNDNKKKEELKKVFANSNIQFRNMQRIVKELFDDSVLSEYDISDPAFALKVAYERGYRKALKEVYNLIPTTIKTK